MTHHRKPEPTTLICPKCKGRMSTYERNGVLIDQCHDCRGIFLDRGEIERLIEAGNPTGEYESGPEGGQRGAQAPQRRAHASSVIADMLVLMAMEPKHPHPATPRPANKAHGGR